VSDGIVILFGQVFSITVFIASSTFQDKFLTFASIFPCNCFLVKDIPVVLIASHTSIHFLMSFQASVIVVGINLALGSFLICLNNPHIAHNPHCIATNSATSFAVGSLHSVVT
jgi:hypothetical protein